MLYFSTPTKTTTRSFRALGWVATSATTFFPLSTSPTVETTTVSATVSYTGATAKELHCFGAGAYAAVLRM